MSKIFISHSSTDNAKALALFHWLKDNGWGDSFLDFSTENGLAPGERWQESLKLAADRCEAVVFLISPAWRDSRWCLAEFLLAKQLGKSILGVLIDPVPLEMLPAEMTSEWQLCDLVNGNQRDRFDVELTHIVQRTEVYFASDGLARLKQGLKRAGLDASTFFWPPKSDPERIPYQGLKALDHNDAAIFFGRDVSIVRALDTLRRLRHRESERLFILLGASGAGKSSFLQAGLLPRLARDDRHFFPLPVIRPERAAISGSKGVVNSLQKAFLSLGKRVNRGEIRKAINSPFGFSTLLAEIQSMAHERFVSDAANPPTVLISVDQAEEIYGSDDIREADILFSLIQEVLATQVPESCDPVSTSKKTIVLMGIRSDSYERFQTDPRLKSVKQYLFRLPPIPKEEFKSVIEGPAERQRGSGKNLTIDPLLTERLLNDTRGADALPLLAFTLERLLVEKGGDGKLTLNDYEDIGGVTGSIHAAIKDAFKDPGKHPEIPSDRRVREELLRKGLVPWLAQVDPDTDERKRRVALWDEIPRDSKPMLERLLEKRLLLRDRRTLTRGGEDKIVVEVAHEAILRRWALLTTWLDEDAEAIKEINRAVRAGAEWMGNNRNPAWLAHTSKRLGIVENLLQRAELDSLLGKEGRVYIRACRQRDDEDAAREQEVERKSRENKQRALKAEQTAKRERIRLAEAEAEQALERAEAARRLSKRTTIGAILAVILMLLAFGAAWRAFQQQTKAERALAVSSLAEAHRRENNRLAGQSLGFYARAVRLDPNESLFRASLVGSLITKPWIRLKFEIRSPDPVIDPVASAVFSPDGKIVLTAIGDEARLWNTQSGDRVGAAMRHRNTIISAAFSPDGKGIVTGSRDKTVGVWNALDGQPKCDPIRHKGRGKAAFYRDSREIITHEGVFEASTGKKLLDTPGNDFWRGASPRGRFCLIRTENRVKLWSLETKKFVGGEVPDPGYYGLSFMFSEDESRVAILAGYRLYVRSTQTGADVINIRTVRVDAMAMSKNGRYLAIHWGGNLGAWDIDTRKVLGPVIELDSKLDKIEISPDGKLLTALHKKDWDEKQPGNPSVWHTPTGEDITSSLGRLDLWPPGFSSQHSRTIIASDQTARLVDTATGNRIGNPIIHSSKITMAGFSADNRIAVSISGSQVRLHDAKTGIPMGEPILHPGNVTHFSFSSDGIHLLTVSPRCARVWDIRTETAAQQPMGPVQDSEEASNLAFSPLGTHVAGISQSAIQLWDAQKRTRIGTLPWGGANGSPPDIDSMGFSRDGSRVFLENSYWGEGDYERFLTVWNVQTREPVGTSLSLYSTNYKLSPDGRKLVQVAANNKSARIWDVDSGTRMGRLLRHRMEIQALAISRDGKWVATASADDSARVWSMETGEPVGNLMRHDRTVLDVKFSGDGSRIATLSAEVIKRPDWRDQLEWVPRKVRVWEAKTGRPLGKTIHHEFDITSMDVNADGGRILTTSGNTARIWDARSGRAFSDPMEHESQVGFGVFSPEGSRILTLSGKSARIWDAERSVPIGAPMMHTENLQSAFFLPGGQRIVTITKTGGDSPRIKAQLWDTPICAPGDAGLLADLAEVMGGYEIMESGSTQMVLDPIERLTKLQAELSSGDKESSPGRAIIHWLISAPETRTGTPLESWSRENALK